MPKQPEPAIVERINFGGLADSRWSGIANSVFKMIGIDVHTKPGLISVRQALSKDSGATVTGFVKVRVATSDGDSYWFDSDSGKIWKRTSGGTWSLVHTTTPDFGDAGCLGAMEYNDYLIWATEKRLHRIPISGLSDWSTNVEEDWVHLNLEQDDIGGSGAEYTLGTSIAETATHKQTFTSYRSPIESVGVNIDTVGTGNWTVTIHDENDTSLGSVTIANGSLTTGWNVFEFSSVLYPVIGSTYHIHITSTVADGKVETATASDLEDGNVRIYTTSDPSFHPMIVLNSVLYIGDRHFVHQVDGVTFSHRALDINPPLRIKSFGYIKTDLLIGTYVNDNVNNTKIYRWNTYSVSFSSSDPIPEVGINAFFESDNLVFVQAGISGNIYMYNGEQLETFKRIPGEYSPTKTAVVHPNAVANLSGLMLFGLSNLSGNPTEQGVYVFGRNDRKYPHVLDLSFPISERSAGAFVTSSIEIGAILVMGFDVFVSWKNGSTYGVDKLDYSTKLNGAYFETRMAYFDRRNTATVEEIIIPYYQIPTDCSLALSVDRNYTGTYSAVTTRVDDKKKIVRTDNVIPEVGVIQGKVVFTTNSNDCPEIESVGMFPK